MEVEKREWLVKPSEEDGKYVVESIAKWTGEGRLHWVVLSGGSDYVICATVAHGFSLSSVPVRINVRISMAGDEKSVDRITIGSYRDNSWVAPSIFIDALDRALKDDGAGARLASLVWSALSKVAETGVEVLMRNIREISAYNDSHPRCVSPDPVTPAEEREEVVPAEPVPAMITSEDIARIGEMVARAWLVVESSGDRKDVAQLKVDSSGKGLEVDIRREDGQDEVYVAEEGVDAKNVVFDGNRVSITFICYDDEEAGPHDERLTFTFLDND